MRQFYNYLNLPGLFIASLLIIFTSFTSQANKGLTFSIDIGSFDQRIDQDELRGFNYIIEKKADGQFNYKVGEYADLIRAQRDRNILKERGFESSEVVAFFNYNAISMDDAYTLMDNRNAEDEKAYSVEAAKPAVKVEDLNEILDNYNNDMYFTVQIGYYGEQKTDDDFEIPETVDERSTADGNYRYTTGKFLNYDEAAAKKELLQKNGVPDAFVIAYKGGKRVSVQDALQPR